MSRDSQGRFVKGTSGNPNRTPGPGRPKIGRSLSEAIRARGHEIDQDSGETGFVRLSAGLWDIALHHEDADVRLRATREIADRTEGRPPQKVDITTDGDSLIKGYPQALVDKVT